MSTVNSERQLNTIELFAGVGGFRLGLERVHGNPYRVTLSNQFEPSRKVQHASKVYLSRWTGDLHLNQDIAEVLRSEAGRASIRAADADVVVGGFPCQDYSVAKPLSQSFGISGKKGVLWWSIAELLQQRIDDGKPVKYLILENVDRLISSPAACRGRDFAMVLSTLHRLGYAAEWRVVNAADYGFPQRRRRTFIVAFHESTKVFQQLAGRLGGGLHTCFGRTVLSRALPGVLCNEYDGAAPALRVHADPFVEQLSYRPLSNGRSRFENAGVMLDGGVWTSRVTPAALADFSEFTGHKEALTLGDVVSKSGPVPTSFYVPDSDRSRWAAAKAAKRALRTKNGFDYEYSEGAMAFPEPLDRPSRTIITSEGGTTPSRTKHVIGDSSGRLRRLTPEELEELNGFPRGFTECDGVSDVARAMLMGNALVVGLVTRIGDALYHAHVMQTP
ncbi:DNA-cytosine methyltransferase [Paraburkholderia hospita]|uniref:Cytosine-specific methyltransferase n=1 Tax=Paraburkholderia hospita TaxID=169430 RepID=A0ABN0FCD4_9BURK|nr:DNA (cytosine-5-)-methyltransferase [Paraburkholderia hospita]EIM96353.1 DNA-cytosine methyltransferase [Paraburkholderia hospita]OUL83650.1 DNA (cytosine-5-)-methyltransferase [Paraburkholderia hospita]